jgi:hypothetical protein
MSSIPLEVMMIIAVNCPDRITFIRLLKAIPDVLAFIKDRGVSSYLNKRTIKHESGNVNTYSCLPGGIVHDVLRNEDSTIIMQYHFGIVRETRMKIKGRIDKWIFNETGVILRKEEKRPGRKYKLTKYKDGIPYIIIDCTHLHMFGYNEPHIEYFHNSPVQGEGLTRISKQRYDELNKSLGY